FDLAALDRTGDDAHADLVDFHTLGCGVGRRSDCRRVDRLVLAERNPGGRGVTEKRVLDLSGLPLHAMGSASPTWWGTLGFMLLEGSGFALVIAIYLYLGSLAREWPPA